MKDSGWVFWWWGDSPGWEGATGRLFKLYVSPHPEDIPDVLSACLTEIRPFRPLCLKLSGWLEGLLRPDKLVSYFREKGDLLEAAEALAPRLEAARPQGVPFSAGLDPRGILSWGIDPTPGVLGATSWRRTQTDRLSRDLVRAWQCGMGPDSWKYALARLALSGVDEESFAPGANWKPSNGP